MNFRTTTLGERLKFAREKRGLTQQELADMVNMSQPSLYNVEGGRNRGTTKVVELSIALDISPIWLQLGIGNMENSKEEPVPVSLKDSVPLISWVAAGNWSSIECRDLENSVEKWLPCPVKHSTDTYALRVVGQSMRNVHSPLSFNEGDIIFVDPKVEPENKSCVIAYKHEDNETTFKQLIIDEHGQKFLAPLNPTWPEPTIPINGNASILGVVIGKWVDIKFKY